MPKVSRYCLIVDGEREIAEWDSGVTIDMKIEEHAGQLLILLGPAAIYAANRKVDLLLDGEPQYTWKVGDDAQARLSH